MGANAHLTGCHCGIVHLACGGIGVGARGSQFSIHVCKLALDQLVMGNGRAELLADVGVRKNQVECGLHDSAKGYDVNREWMME